MSADSVLVIGIILGIIGCIIYLFGLVRINTDVLSASILFHLHMAFTIFFELFDVCYSSGFSQSKRDKSPEFNNHCQTTCDANNTNACQVFRKQTCTYRSSAPSAIVGVIIQLVIKVYFGYILWSYWVRFKSGSLESGTAGVAMPAVTAVQAASVPMAIPAESIPVAIPVERGAVPVAQHATPDERD
eukprot:758184-Hanusia_phi.AAC.13